MPRPAKKEPLRRSVYVIKNDIGMCKVGIALDPKVRLKELQTGSPHPLRIAYSIVTNDASGVEARAHAILSRYHVHLEWFKCDPRTAEEAVNRAAQLVSDSVDAGGVFFGVIGRWLFGLFLFFAIWVAVALALTKG